MAKPKPGAGKHSPKKNSAAKTSAQSKPAKGKKKTASKAGTVKKKPTPASPAGSTRPKTVKKAGGKAGAGEKQPNAPGTSKAGRMDVATDGGKPVLYALVIGCDCYLPNTTEEGTYPSLEGCVRDAENVEAFLRKRAGLTDERLIKLTSTSGSNGKPKEPPEHLPTYENMVNAFRTIAARAHKNDRVYVHYSGHGGQCPTIVPKLKGKNGLDESLVPIDIGDPKARYFRDVEMAKLLGELSEKDLIVTVVLDSCHSGGATRAVARAEQRVGVRGVDFVDYQPRPASLVGTPDELAAAVPPPDQQTRGFEATRGMAASAQASGCVVLAACRPNELAREYPFDGANTVGALTYWFLTTVGAGPDDLSFRTVYDVVLARIHGQFEAQTPMLLGDADRTILAGIAVESSPIVPVNAVSTDGKTITLGSGQAGLVRIDDEYAIYPPGADLADQSVRTALAQVKSVGASTSTAQVAKLLGSRKVMVGDGALALGVAQQLVRKVRTTPADKAPAKAADYLKQVAQAINGETWIKLAGADADRADYVITTSEDGKKFVMCDAGGVPLLIRPELATGAENSAKDLAARLVHLARFQSISTLDNTDSFSPLRGKVTAKLFATPKGYQDGDSLEGLKPFPPGSVAPGSWVVLEVANQANMDVNAFVLDLGSNWEVSLAHPEERFHQIARGTSWQLPLNVSLPKGQKSGKDILKVIATIDPSPPFETLLLPPLDEPIADRGVSRGLSAASGLEAALEAVGGRSADPFG